MPGGGGVGGGGKGAHVASLLLRAAFSSWRLATSASRSGGEGGGGEGEAEGGGGDGEAEGGGEGEADGGGGEGEADGGGGAWARHTTSERPSICVKLVRSASAASCADVERGPASAVVAKVMMRSGMT